ncbi:MAG: glycosyltransferase family 25 protein [Woeseia sp.]|nr:glycosyltransferase family 25 protein [Woeseia sp.]
MRTFVISLPESIERRARIEQQLASQDVPFSFYDAINLNNERNHYFHHCDEQRFLLNTGRTPTAGELGCFASHLMLWRTCRLLDVPILVLEDDADIADDFGRTLPFVERYIKRFGFIRLQDNDKGGERNVIRQQQRHINFCTRYPHGSLGYAISPEVAHAFIEHSEIFRAPVDVFIKRYWEHGQALFSIAPALASTSELSRHSTIVERQHATRSLTLKSQRWWQKRLDFVARAKFNVNWLRSERKRAALRMTRRIRLAGFRSQN